MPSLLPLSALTSTANPASPTRHKPSSTTSATCWTVDTRSWSGNQHTTDAIPACGVSVASRAATSVLAADPSSCPPPIRVAGHPEIHISNDPHALCSLRAEWPGSIPYLAGRDSREHRLVQRNAPRQAAPGLPHSRERGADRITSSPASSQSRSHWSRRSLDRSAGCRRLGTDPRAAGAQARDERQRGGGANAVPGRNATTRSSVTSATESFSGADDIQCAGRSSSMLGRSYIALLRPVLYDRRSPTVGCRGLGGGQGCVTPAPTWLGFPGGIDGGRIEKGCERWTTPRNGGGSGSRRSLD